MSPSKLKQKIEKNTRRYEKNFSLYNEMNALQIDRGVGENS